MSSPAPSAADGKRQAAMPFILITVLIDMLSIGLIVPVLPALVGKFTADTSAQAHWVGVLFTVFSLASFVCAPTLSALSDRFGRRPLLLFGFCGLAINFFVTAMATSLAMLLVSRIIGGGMQANAAVAQAYVADITEPQDRTRRFGALGAMFGLGFILGPAMGGLLGGIDIHLPFYAAGTLALLNLVYGSFVLPESLPPERRRPVNWKSANPFASLRALSQLKGVGLLVGVMACAGLAQFSLYATWVLYNTQRFGWGPTENGWSLFAVGIVSALVQGVLLSRLLKFFGRERLALLAIASSATAYLLWGLSTSPWMFYAVIFGNVLGSALQATMQGIVSSAADARHQGQTMGAMTGLSSLMAVIGPMLAAPLMGAVSHLPRDDWRVGTPYFFGAALLVLAWCFAFAHFRRHSSAQARNAAPDATPP